MKLAERLTNFFFQDETISDEEREIIQFGLESIVGNLIGVVLTLAVGIFFRHVGEALLLWLWLFFLRKNAGGFHASTRAKCLLISTGTLIVSFMIFVMIKHTIFFYSISIVVAGCIIWILAPVDNPSKELDKFEYKEYQWRSRIILAVEGMIYILAMCFKWETVSRSINMAFFIVSVSLLIGNKRGANNET